MRTKQSLTFLFSLFLSLCSAAAFVADHSGSRVWRTTCLMSTILSDKDKATVVDGEEPVETALQDSSFPDENTDIMTLVDDQNDTTTSHQHRRNHHHHHHTRVNLKETMEIIPQLQKKLRFFEHAQEKKLADYKLYVHQQNLAKGLKPIYEREGKIDKYKLRPIFDHETEQIQTEIWTIKEQIMLVAAKVEQEERVQQVRDQVKGEVATAVAEQKRLRDQAQAKLNALQAEYTLSLQELQTQSSQRLSEKEQEIDSLREEIQGLLGTLKQKRQELGEKEQTVVFLDSALQEKESRLRFLLSERTSLRALARQSWKVFKMRVRKRLGRDGGNASAIEADDNKEEMNEIMLATKEDGARQLVRVR